jgi:hypothetical protein
LGIRNKLKKLASIVLASDPVWINALRLGVAASTEHMTVGLVRINTLFHHTEKYRHPWELLSILTFGRLHPRVE